VGLKIEPDLGIFVIKVPFNQNELSNVKENIEPEEITESKVKEVISGGITEEQLIPI